MAVSVTSTASVAVNLPGKGNTIRMVNEGPNNAYFAIAASNPVATVPTTTPLSTCTPILAGEDLSLTIPADQTYMISAICRATQTAILVMQVGEGV